MHAECFDCHYQIEHVYSSVLCYINLITQCCIAIVKFTINNVRGFVIVSETVTAF